MSYNRRDMLKAAGMELDKVFKSTTWIIGVCLFLMGNIIMFVSYGFAAQSLLSALSSVQLLSNVAFSVLILRESVKFKIIIAIGLIILGNLLIVLFGSRKDDAYSAEQLVQFYDSVSYIVFCVLSGVGSVITWLLYVNGESWARCFPEDSQESISQSIAIFYAFSAAAIGCQAMVFSKSLSTLIRSTFEGNLQLGHWYFYVSIASLFIVSIFWINRINTGLRKFSAITIIPMLQVLFTLMSIISGAIYYRELEGFTVIQLIMFVLGIANMLVGIYLLAPGKPIPAPPPMEEDISDGQKSDLDISTLASLTEIELSQMKEELTAYRGEPESSPADRAVSGVRRSIVNAAKSTVALGDNQKLRALSVFALPIPYNSQEEEFCAINWFSNVEKRHSSARQSIRTKSFSSSPRQYSIEEKSNHNSLHAQVYDDDADDDYTDVEVRTDDAGYSNKQEKRKSVAFKTQLIEEEDEDDE